MEEPFAACGSRGPYCTQWELNNLFQAFGILLNTAEAQLGSIVALPYIPQLLEFKSLHGLALPMQKHPGLAVIVVLQPLLRTSS